MKLLIAGGAGYVGSILIPRLLDRGYKVDVVDLFWFGNHLPRQVGILNKDIFQLSEEDLERSSKAAAQVAIQFSAGTPRVTPTPVRFTGAGHQCLTNSLLWRWTIL